MTARQLFSRSTRFALAGTSATAFCIATAYTTVALAESPANAPAAPIKRTSTPRDQSKATFAWGKTRHSLAAIQDDVTDQIKKPTPVPALDGVVLRDLAFHDQYAVAVDKRGDLLQWDHRQSEPIKVLGGRNIIKVALTPYKIYALSSSGKVFVLSSTSIPKAQSTSSWLLSWVWNSPHGAEHLELKTDKSLGMREHVRDIQAGTSHILALTSSGRCFSSPVDMRANEMGQLGVRSVHLAGVGNTQLYPQGFNPNEVATPDNRALSMELAQAKAMPRNWLSDETKSQLDQSEEASRLSEAAQQAAKVARQQYALAEQHIGFSQTLYEIPSLRNLKIAQIAVGDQHNLVKTQHGRVLAFGSNSCGQLGVGSQLALSVIPTPAEVALNKHAPRDGALVCTQIAAGGDSSFFVTRREEPERPAITELYAAGNGQFGAIGNGLWNHQAAPVKIKTLSGLLEWDEKRNRMATIHVHNISVGRNHVAATLSNASSDDRASYGRDVYIWGQNSDSQLGNGKRSNAPLPIALGALPRNESVLAAKRMQLAPPTKVQGNKVEETIRCSHNSTAVYWRALN